MFNEGLVADIISKKEVNALFIFESADFLINIRFLKDFKTKKQVVFDTTKAQGREDI